jgi:TrmH family RNA methyltransferase
MEKVSKKLVSALSDKKTRSEKKLFLVEGETTFFEMLGAMDVYAIVTTRDFFKKNARTLEAFQNKITFVDAGEISSWGTLATNKTVLGIFKFKELPKFTFGNEIIIALSGIGDPGNLGALIRIADWYGVRKIVAAKGTVDLYNPKTISASKGSLARVDVYYEDLEEFLSSQKSVSVFGADLRGKNVHTLSFPQKGILLLGNEAHGIADDLKKYISEKITIPSFGGAESLNVAIAGAVILDNWKRSLS